MLTPQDLAGMRGDVETTFPDAVTITSYAHEDGERVETGIQVQTKGRLGPHRRKSTGDPSEVRFIEEFRLNLPHGVTLNLTDEVTVRGITIYPVAVRTERSFDVQGYHVMGRLNLIHEVELAAEEEQATQFNEVLPSSEEEHRIKVFFDQQPQRGSEVFGDQLLALSTPAVLYCHLEDAELLSGPGTAFRFQGDPYQVVAMQKVPFSGAGPHAVILCDRGAQ